MNKIIALALLGISSWTMAATQCVKATTDQLNSSMVPLFQGVLRPINVFMQPWKPHIDLLCSKTVPSDP